MWPLKTTARGAEIQWRWFRKSIWRRSGHFRTIWDHLRLFWGYFCHFWAKTASNGPKWQKLAQNVPEMALNNPEIAQNDLNEFKVTSETISIKILPFLQSFWVVTWLAYDNFKFRPKNSPIIASNGPKWSWNDLSILKLTSETISIGFLLLLRSFCGHMTSLRQLQVETQN